MVFHFMSLVVLSPLNMLSVKNYLRQSTADYLLQKEKSSK